MISIFGRVGIGHPPFSLFSTKDDRSFGRGSHDVKDGDLVCRLQGCSNPVILRQQAGRSETYKLFARAYIADFIDEDKRPPENIKLSKLEGIKSLGTRKFRLRRLGLSISVLTPKVKRRSKHTLTAR